MTTEQDFGKTEVLNGAKAPVSYASFRKSAKKPWTELIDDRKELSENVRAILDRLVILPNHSLHAPIATAYILIPSGLAEILPILFCQGAAGSGKSTIGKLASLVHYGSMDGILGGNATYASIRNYLNKIRWISLEHGEEYNTILVWDDIKAKNLSEKPEIY